MAPALHAGADGWPGFEDDERNVAFGEVRRRGQTDWAGSENGNWVVGKHGVCSFLLVPACSDGRGRRWTQTAAPVHSGMAAVWSGGGRDSARYGSTEGG